MACDSSAPSQGRSRSFESMSETCTPRAAKSEAYSQPATPADTTAYVWDEACKDCHSDIYEAWARTKHKTALNRLSTTEREQPCAACHLTGSATPIVSAGTLYFSTSDSGMFQAVDAGTGKVVATIKNGSRVDALGWDPGKKLIYIPTSSSSSSTRTRASSTPGRSCSSRTTRRAWARSAGGWARAGWRASPRRRVIRHSRRPSM